MLRLGSTHWLHRSPSGTLPLLTFNLSTGKLQSEMFDAPTRGYLRDIIWGVLKKIPESSREIAAPAVVERVIAVTSLTGDATLLISAAFGTVSASIVGLVQDEELLVQVPFSGSMAMLPPAGITQKFDYRHETLGDASTGYYHVTVAARAATETVLDGIIITKNAAASTPGAVGTFAIDIKGTQGVFVHSVTVATYTRAETQAKVLVALDNPQGSVLAHHLVRPTATLFTGAGTQLATPVVTVADADGDTIAENGVPGQLNPTTLYPRLRISAAGLAQATENVVTDPAYNKVQSLVIQF